MEEAAKGGSATISGGIQPPVRNRLAYLAGRTNIAVRDERIAVTVAELTKRHEIGRVWSWIRERWGNSVAEGYVKVASKAPTLRIKFADKTSLTVGPQQVFYKLLPEGLPEETTAAELAPGDVLFAFDGTLQVGRTRPLLVASVKEGPLSDLYSLDVTDLSCVAVILQGEKGILVGCAESPEYQAALERGDTLYW